MNILQSIKPDRLVQILKLLACVLIVRVTVAIVLNYHNYLPPDFTSEFLQERESYFFGSYRWAFYAHIISGPYTLLLSLVLVSDRFRSRYLRLHRILGRVQVVCVLFFVVPSGLWMAFYADSGVIAVSGFASLAIATGTCVAFGFRAVLRRRFTAHRRWMWRTSLLLCSAVVLRIIGGIVTVLGLSAEWTYPMAAWISWLIPLIAFEFFERVRKKV